MLNDAVGFEKNFIATGCADYPRSIIIREVSHYRTLMRCLVSVK